MSADNAVHAAFRLSVAWLAFSALWGCSSSDSNGARPAAAGGAGLAAGGAGSTGGMGG
ncbi:MAG: hypothetical protein WDO74_25040 [Pseudomonadota bacterium]